MKRFCLVVTLILFAGCEPIDFSGFGPDPLGPNAPLYQQSWAYGTEGTLETAEQTDITDPQLTLHVEGTTELYWDDTPEGIDPTGASSLKIVHNETGLCCGAKIVLPAGEIFPAEIWHEQWVKYEAGWNISSVTDCGGEIEEYNLHPTTWYQSNTSDLGTHQYVFGSWRGNELFVAQSRASGRMAGWTIGSSIVGNYDAPVIDIWDGEWHRLRFYLRHPPKEIPGEWSQHVAWYSVWIDNSQIIDGPGWKVNNGQAPTWTNGTPYWSLIDLGGRQWCTPPQPQAMWYGRTIVYHKDPNWN